MGVGEEGKGDGGGRTADSFRLLLAKLRREGRSATLNGLLLYDKERKKENKRHKAYYLIGVKREKEPLIGISPVR